MLYDCMYGESFNIHIGLFIGTLFSINPKPVLFIFTRSQNWIPKIQDFYGTFYHKANSCALLSETNSFLLAERLWSFVAHNTLPMLYLPARPWDIFLQFCEASDFSLNSEWHRVLFELSAGLDSMKSLLCFKVAQSSNLKSFCYSAKRGITKF